MGSLTAAFPNWACAPMTVRLFYAVLADCERADLERAVLAYIANETQWPTAAGLRRYAQPQKTLSVQLTAAEAWDELYRNRHSRRDKPNWSSEIVRRAAEAVRWADRDWQSDQIPTIRAQFERYYNALMGKKKFQAQIEVAQELLVMSRDRKHGPQQIAVKLEAKP
jgi:hypothetical protein